MFDKPCMYRKTTSSNLDMLFLARHTHDISPRRLLWPERMMILPRIGRQKFILWMSMRFLLDFGKMINGFGAITGVKLWGQEVRGARAMVGIGVCEVLGLGEAQRGWEESSRRRLNVCGVG